MTQPPPVGPDGPQNFQGPQNFPGQQPPRQPQQPGGVSGPPPQWAQGGPAAPQNQYRQGPGPGQWGPQGPQQVPAAPIGFAGLADDKRKIWIGALVAAVLVLLGSFMPWASVSVFGQRMSVAGTEGDGIITLVLSLVAAGALVAAVFASGSFVRHLHWVALGAGALIAIIPLITMSNLGSISRETGGIGSASLGFGAVLVLLAGIALAVLSFLFGRRSSPSRENGRPVG